MKINNYEFGKIIVDNKEYNSDLIIFPDRIIPNWWRKSGHSLDKEDLREVLKFNPKVIIIGTGFSGVLEVPNKIRDLIEKKAIKLIIQRTKDACKTFNEFMESKEKVVGCFHLTC